MKHLLCLSIIALVWAFFPSCSTETTKSEKPNILFHLADDLGYGELGCYGQEVIQSPVLDKMAAEGMHFTNF